MRTKPEIEELERTRGVQLGRQWKQALEDGKCPFCGRPTTGVRRYGEDHQAYEVGAVVVRGCGCQIGCGHVARQYR